MIGYILKRIAALIPILFGISVVSFLLLYLCPGDPAQIAVSALMGTETPPEEAVKAVRLELGLHLPFPTQYAYWLKRVSAGDLGYSYQTGRSVVREIGAALPASAWLAGAAMTLMGLIVVPLGVISAARKNTLWDKTALLGSLMAISTPDFFIAVLFIYFFSVSLKVLPVAGYGSWENVVLPASALAVANAAISVRLMRTSMLAALGEKYIVTARSKGLYEFTVVARHALKNAMVPVLTYAGTQFGYLFGGTVVVETIFMWPGLGRLLVESVKARDVFVVQGCVLTIAFLYVLINLAVDVLCAVIDPRIRYAPHHRTQ